MCGRTGAEAAGLSPPEGEAAVIIKSKQMLKKMSSRRKVLIAFCIFATGLAACSAPPRPATVPSLVAFPGAPTAHCVQEEVLPTIEQVSPPEIRAGTEVLVTARGGYFRDNCGGFNESSRAYKLYFDDEPVTDLWCYVNHCEGKFVLPASVAAGRHCMGVQKGSCQTEIDVEGG
jgi:hypothetical protein